MKATSSNKLRKCSKLSAHLAFFSNQLWNESFMLNCKEMMHSRNVRNAEDFKCFRFFFQLLINVSTCIHSFRQSLKFVDALWLNQVFPISMHITICENSIAFHSIKKEFQIDWCYEKIKSHYIYHGITYFLLMLLSSVRTMWFALHH